MDISIATEKLSGQQWGLIFTLLSLDIVFPFYQDMGLDVSDKEKFLYLLRDVIIDNRADYVKNPNSIPPLAEKVFQKVQIDFDISEAEHLYKWSTEVFYWVHSDLPQWSSLEILFTSTSFLQRLREQIFIDFDKWDKIVGELNRCLFLENCKIIVAQQSQNVLSNWDLEMYAIHKFADSLSNPNTLVLNVIRMNRIQLFWEWFKLQFTELEKNIIMKVGNNILLEIGVWMPEPLYHPNKLIRKL